MSTFAMLVKKTEINIFYIINRRLRNKITDLLMKLITQLGSTFFCIFISILFLSLGTGNLRYAGVMLSVNLIISQIIIQTLKRIVNRPRPYRTHMWVRVIMPPKCRYSFPSGHTCSAFIIAFTISVFFPWLKPFLFALAALVGISRIYLGCHYPSDVFSGLGISYIVFAVMSYGFPIISNYITGIL